MYYEDVKNATGHLKNIEDYLISLNSEIVRMRKELTPWYMRLYNFVLNHLRKVK